MNTYSHILMGRVLCGYLEKHCGIRLERKSFVLGNVLPDYVPSFLLKPHFGKNNARHIQKTLRQIAKRKQGEQKRTSRLLGILCHFYSDSLCYAHSEAFTGNIPEHMQYEKQLHAYFTEHLKEITACRFILPPCMDRNAAGLYRRFESIHRSYIAVQPAFANDLLYAMMACLDAIVSIAGHTAAIPEAPALSVALRAV